MIKSKYTMIMLKLIEAKTIRDTINIEKYSRRIKEMVPRERKPDSPQQVLNVGIEGLKPKFH